MSVYSKTRSIVRACRWWEDREEVFCPLYNDCCEVCMHPNAPRDNEGRRPVIMSSEVLPDLCPLRKRDLLVEML